MEKRKRQESIKIEKGFTLTRIELKQLLFEVMSEVKQASNYAYDLTQEHNPINLEDSVTLPDIIKEQEKLIETRIHEPSRYYHLVGIKDYSKMRYEFLKKKYEFLHPMYYELDDIYENFDDVKDLHSLYILLRQLAKSLDFLDVLPDRIKIQELRKIPNYKRHEYPYEVRIPYTKLKKGMRIIDYDDFSENYPLMYVVQEDVFLEPVGYDKNCKQLVLRLLAKSRDGMVISETTTNIGYIEELEYDEDTFASVYFTSIEEAKSFGFEESELKESDL